MEQLQQYWAIVYDFLIHNKQLALWITYGLLFLCVLLFVSAMITYLRRNHIFALIKAKITGDIEKRDEIRKKNISADIKKRKVELYEVNNEEQKQNQIKKFFIDAKKKINSLIFYTGLLNIPGFSTTTMFVLLGFVSVLFFTLAIIFRGLFLGLTVLIVVQIFFWYGLALTKYNRRNKLEGQLLQLINDITTASLQYSNIIDIFGVIYPNYTEPLSGALEICFVEAKRTHNQKLAMEHLKEKFDSMQFNFIIDNFILCSETMSNYTEISTNLADTVGIYNASYEKKKAIINNAKIELVILFSLAILVIILLNGFLTNLISVLFNTAFGNIMIIVLISILVYGLNIKGERT